LAISPALKKLGVKNRSRLFEIPPHIEYLTVKPHMKRYMQVSAEIYGILLNFLFKEAFIKIPYKIRRMFCENIESNLGEE